MIEVEIGRPLSDEEPINAGTGRAYRRALALVRFHAVPLGVVELAVEDGGIGADQLARHIWEALGVKINAHLRADGLPEVTELGRAGLAAVGTPACIQAREAFLATAPFVSVVTPTHERPQQVVALVRSILASAYPEARYEILVVDNAPSSNATADLIEQTFGDCRQVRYVREDRPGTSHARNCGVAAARGDIVVFADDDELVDEHWLTEMVRGFGAADDVASVTGLIVPLESETLAQGWFEQFGGYCKEQCESRLFNLADHHAAGPLFPYNVGVLGAGGSMAFRRATLLEIGAFDTALGATTPTLGGEDIDALLRVVLEGYSLLYQPAALVRHPPYREYAQLRRQIVCYGTGLTACLFKNVVAKPRLLPDFLGKLPRGILFAFGSRSSHHAGKRPDYPRELTWLEIRGLLYGPLAYLRSRRRLARATRRARPGVPNARVEPLALSTGDTH
jgi:glycosyltransferase involved in cell wall biosynthesis